MSGSDQADFGAESSRRRPPITSERRRVAGPGQSMGHVTQPGGSSGPRRADRRSSGRTALAHIPRPRAATTEQTRRAQPQTAVCHRAHDVALCWSPPMGSVDWSPRDHSLHRSLNSETPSIIIIPPPPHPPQAAMDFSFAPDDPEDSWLACALRSATPVDNIMLTAAAVDRLLDAQGD